MSSSESTPLRELSMGYYRAVMIMAFPGLVRDEPDAICPRVDLDELPASGMEPKAGTDWINPGSRKCAHGRRNNDP